MNSILPLLKWIKLRIETVSFRFRTHQIIAVTLLFRAHETVVGTFGYLFVGALLDRRFVQPMGRGQGLAVHRGRRYGCVRGRRFASRQLPLQVVRINGLSAKERFLGQCHLSESVGKLPVELVNGSLTPPQTRRGIRYNTVLILYLLCRF